MIPIILASTSKQRKNLLKLLGLPFKIVASKYEEDMTLPLPPKKLAKFLSLGKAKTVADKFTNSIILSADTFVVYKDEVLGKPHTEKKARTMLQKLSGKKHQVITGYAIIDQVNHKIINEAIASDVYFKKLTDREIKNYIATGEPLEKAGGYAIQGRGTIFIDKVAGDYNNIVGLPLRNIAEYFKKINML